MSCFRSLGTSVFRVAVSFLIFGSTCWAQFTPVGPFTGSYQESFETQDTSNNAFPVCVEDRVFGDRADLCSDNGAGAHITGGWGFGCTMQEHTGSRLFGCTGGAALFTFDTSILKFGGYFGTNNPTASHGTVFFYDGAGVLLYSDTINAPNDCTWNWNGWDFGGAQVKRIRVLSNYSSGGYMLMDSLEAELVPSNVGTPMCFCDGAAGLAPCGNYGSAGHGCGNSFSAGGALLYADGLASVSASSLMLRGVNLVPGWEGVYFQGDTDLNSGAGYVFGDGMRCVGLNVRRLEVVISGVMGTSSTSVDISTVHGNSIAPGESKYYQVWFRDPGPGPCSSGFNLSNAVKIAWTP